MYKHRTLKERRQHLERVIGQDPGNVPAYLALGGLYLECGEVDNALSYCLIAVDKNPECGEAWVMLGYIYRLRQEYQTSEVSCRKGVSLLPKSADARVQLAGTLNAKGSLKEAAAEYEAALELNSENTAVWYQLCGLYIQLGEYSNVETCCRAIIARTHGVADPYINLGSALQQQNKLNDAESAYRDALKINSALEKANLNLIVVQYRLGKFDEAIKSTLRAAEKGIDAAEALNQVGAGLEREGNQAEALYCSLGALNSSPNNLEYRRHFIDLLNAVRPRHVSKVMLGEIERCFVTGGLSTSRLVSPCLTLLQENHELTSLLECADKRDKKAILDGMKTGKYQEIFQDTIFLKLLEQTIIPLWEYEELFAILRSIFLDLATGYNQLEVDECLSKNIDFVCALACNHFNTEYVSLVSAGELVRAEDLAVSLIDAVKDGGILDSVTISRLAISCMYKPLSTLNLPENIIDELTNTRNDVIKNLFKLQWLDCMEEQLDRSNILQLTPILGTVSGLVRDQYECSPYPRWQNTNTYRPLSVYDFMQHLFPSYEPDGLLADELEVLIAGCGTGRQAIMTASILARSKVLAIDLSLGSLAYGRRKARELGVNNITFAQADILELQTERKFHVIESVGVLHHLAEPESGLEILVKCLETDGLLRLGLYSSMARRGINAAKKFLSVNGYGTSPEEIQRARKEIHDLDDDDPARDVIRALDFFSLSECRDLLFHTQERSYRMHEISSMLDNCGLKCIGFESPGYEVSGRYDALFPDDSMRASFANWETFETMYPDTFTGMYMFWCKRTC